MEELATIPPGYGAMGLFFVLMVTWMKLRPAMEKIKSEDSISLRGDLMTRVRELEALNASERKECDDKLDASQKVYDDKLSDMQEKHERAISRMEEAHARIVKDMQDRVDTLLEALLATKERAKE
jgi:flagellar biosynthesis/type III secretory pathway M-ring protein FliF/YscJ